MVCQVHVNLTRNGAETKAQSSLWFMKHLHHITHDDTVGPQIFVVLNLCIKI